tara:strand:+ start:1947 stop:2279 length:333 start_codon:yes stop_codon:yes gene_type:complete
MDIAATARCLEALGNETRLEVYRILVRAGREGLSVGDLQQRTGVVRSTLSHHLQKLIGVGLISQRRDGTTLYCLANYDNLQAAMGFLASECCADEGAHAPDRGKGASHAA